MFSKVPTPIKILVCLIHVKMSFSDMSKLIKYGEISKIEDFPYSAFLAVQCSRNSSGFFSCGASVVNQAILLTAAHCLFHCKAFTFASATFGHAEFDKGMLLDVYSFKLHNKYVEYYLSNDIALVLLEKPLKFSSRVSRVSLLRKRPDQDGAVVAGWGIDENLESTSHLKHARQRVLHQSTCLFMLENPPGTLCGESGWKSPKSVPSNADSGSALVVDKFIQIGLVSYNNPSLSKTITVYTNISYFYDWIKENAVDLYCIRQPNETKTQETQLHPFI